MESSWISNRAYSGWSFLNTFIKIRVQKSVGNDQNWSNRGEYCSASIRCGLCWKFATSHLVCASVLIIFYRFLDWDLDESDHKTSIRCGVNSKFANFPPDLRFSFGHFLPISRLGSWWECSQNLHPLPSQKSVEMIKIVRKLSKLKHKPVGSLRFSDRAHSRWWFSEYFHEDLNLSAPKPAPIDHKTRIHRIRCNECSKMKFWDNMPYLLECFSIHFVKAFEFFDVISIIIREFHKFDWHDETTVFVH